MSDDTEAMESDALGITDAASVVPPKPRGKRKGPSVQWKFRERMKREGRIEEYERILAEVQDQGKKYGVALWETMKRMGYTDSDEENRIYRIWENAQQERLAGDRDAADRADFDRIFRGLPDKCPTEAELDWIRSHPAMLVKARHVNEDSRVVLRAADLCPGHGPAPAKSAVIALQNWANKPAEFFKILLGEQKKKTDSGGGEEAAGVVVDTELSEVERMLKEVGGG